MFRDVRMSKILGEQSLFGGYDLPPFSLTVIVLTYLLKQLVWTTPNEPKRSVDLLIIFLTPAKS